MRHKKLFCLIVSPKEGRRVTKPNGVILYSGPSLLDGAPIVAIATGLTAKSTNRKTGAMVQTYNLRANVSPTEAVASGGDKSICGDCRHRGSKEYGANGYVKIPKKRTCYVNVGQGPQAVYRAYRAGKYPGLPDEVSTVSALGKISDGRIVRLGTYGDPAAVPAHIWDSLVAYSDGYTGYTHQWRTATGLKGLCMASVDSFPESLEAQALGWRTFRVGLSALDSDLGPVRTRKPGDRHEVLCPASKEAGKLLTCAQCLACGGADGRKGSIWIPAHGGFAVQANIRRLAGIPIRVA